jgi:hypothetical protein
MVEMKRLWSAVLLLLLLVLCADASFAKPGPRDKKEAGRLDKQAEALVKKGEREQAIDRLREADRLDPSASRKVRLAKVLIDLARLMEATEVLVDASEDRTTDRKERPSVEKAKKLLGEVTRRTPTLLVRVLRPEPSAVKVEIDGKSFDPAAGPQPLDPGYHQLGAQATGYQPLKKEISLAEGARETVDLSLKKPGEADGQDAEPVADSAEGGGFSRWPAIVSWGIGAVGLGFGVGYGVVAIQDTNQLREDYNCQDNRCPAAATDDLAATKLEGNISTVGFVVAGVGLVTGTILWLVAGSDDEDPSAAPEADGSTPADAEATGLRLEPLVGIGTVGLRGAF